MNKELTYKEAKSALMMILTSRPYRKGKSVADELWEYIDDTAHHEANVAYVWNGPLEMTAPKHGCVEMNVLMRKEGLDSSFTELILLVDCVDAYFQECYEDETTLNIEVRWYNHGVEMRTTLTYEIKEDCDD